MTTYKRRLIPIVDRGFQYKYTALIMGVAAVVSAALGYFLLDAYTEMNSMIEISDEIGQAMNSDDARRVFYLVTGFLAGEVIVLGILGLVITHRVCGPVFVLQRHLATIVEGKYPTLRPLRTGDEFREAFETFSRTVTMLRERDRKEAELLKRLIEVAQAKGVPDDDLAAVRTLVAERETRAAS